MATTLEAALHPTADGLTIELVGDIDSGAREVLENVYADASARGTAVLLLDFSAVSYMNSSGIGLLVTLLVRANRNKQRLLAYGLTEHYRQIFELTRLDEAIGIHASEADALAASLT